MMSFDQLKTYALDLSKAGGLTNKENTTFLLGALQTFMQIDADTAVKAAQVNLINAQIQSENSKKALIDQQKLTEVQQTAKVQYDVTTLMPAQKTQIDSQKAMLDQQKLTEVQRTAQETYKTTTLLIDEHTLNTAKTALTNAQKSMTDRQTSGFDDKKRVEQATQASGLVGMIYASGGTIPTDAWTYAKGKVDAI
ncbi:hypothetical protein [Sulfuricurvum sp.]|uniref:hypothetical protein n=1 Tax=Sulfuricurvum sp. TaxID=2025608 RepID=UPI002612F2CE|nr:hypothetical protein [Sulfuricurvum sp.]MDD2267645.1 hypothetical protein [Sulfuricurvum sp.]MDD2784769.1 hypothetical protein [Sulfuricurvum sp.]